MKHFCLQTTEYSRGSLKRDSDVESTHSIDTAARSDRFGTASLSVDSGCPLDSSWCASMTTAVTPSDTISVSSQGSNLGSGTENDSRIRRIDAILNVPDTEEDLEVIRVTSSRGGKSKKKKKRKQKDSVDVGSDGVRDFCDGTDSGHATNGSSADLGHVDSKLVDDLAQRRKLTSGGCTSQQNGSVLKEKFDDAPKKTLDNCVSDLPTDNRTTLSVDISSENRLSRCVLEESFSTKIEEILKKAKQELSHNTAPVDDKKILETFIEEQENSDILCHKEQQIEKHVSEADLLNIDSRVKPVGTNDGETITNSAIDDRTETNNEINTKTDDLSTHPGVLCDSGNGNGRLSADANNVCETDRSLHDDEHLPGQAFHLSDESRAGQSMDLHEDEDIYKHRGLSGERTGLSNYTDMITLISAVPSDETETEEPISSINSPSRDYGIE